MRSGARVHCVSAYLTFVSVTGRQSGLRSHEPIMPIALWYMLLIAQPLVGPCLMSSLHLSYLHFNKVPGLFHVLTRPTSLVFYCAAELSSQSVPKLIGRGE